MAWGAIAGAAAGVAGGLYGAHLDYKAQEKAIKEQERARESMEARMDASASQIQDLTDDYYKRMDRLDKEFDIYDMTEAFTSLYEGVFQPMDIEFQEFTIPAIEAAYSGGVFGPSAMQSGAAKEATLKAQQQLSLKKGELRAQERESAIQRNIGERESQKESAASRLQAGTLAPQMQAGFALPMFEAEQSSIAARLAAAQGLSTSISGLGAAAVSGAQAGQSIQDAINKSKKTGE
jgi:hypothetical protein